MADLYPDDPFLDLWNILHDGSIDAIEGQMPGSLRVTVSIEYLREMFAEPGESFFIQLQDCDVCEFRVFDSTEALTDLAAISQLQLSILSAERQEPAQGQEEVIRIFGDQGALDLRFKHFTLALDSGREFTLDELKAVSQAYWDNWGSDK